MSQKSLNPLITRGYFHIKLWEERKADEKSQSPNNSGLFPPYEKAVTQVKGGGLNPLITRGYFHACKC